MCLQPEAVVKHGHRSAHVCIVHVRMAWRVMHSGNFLLHVRGAQGSWSAKRAVRNSKKRTVPQGGVGAGVRQRHNGQLKAKANARCLVFPPSQR